MTTVKQITANRLNSKKSTGPKSGRGKIRARQNAFRHGLTAETVITTLENVEEYAAFERAVAADYRLKNNLERMLAVRLASLLWRLRRTVAVETGLFQAQGRMIKAQRTEKRIEDERSSSRGPLSPLAQSADGPPLSGGIIPQRERLATCKQTLLPAWQPSISECFFRLTTDNGDILERIDRYEASLWRQAAQTITMLESCRK